MTSLLPANTVPEFHFFQRFRYDWHLVFYSHKENGWFTSQSEAAFTEREGKARDFMNRLQRRLELRQKEMFFFATTEFGDTGSGHLHVLVSLDGLRQKGRVEKMTSCDVRLPQMIEIVRPEMFPQSLKIGCEPIKPEAESQKQLLSYVCKKEHGRDYKHCFYSKWLKAPF
jgi:hypothetical protein